MPPASSLSGPSVGATAAGLALVGLYVHLGTSAATLALLVAASSIPWAYAAVLGSLADAPSTGDALLRGRLPRVVLGLVVLLGLAQALAPPMLSDDVYRYLWEGHLTRSGVDPYAFAPDDPVLAPFRPFGSWEAEVWRQINFPSIPTIYPPIAQGIFAFGAILADVLTPLGLPPSAGLQLLGLLAHLALGASAGLLAGAGARDPGRAAARYWLFPPALLESTQGAHLDVFVGLGLTLALLAVARRLPLRAALAASLATGTKLVGVLLLPLLTRPTLGSRTRRLAALGLASALAALLFAPLPGAGYGSARAGGLSNYARRWRGNDALFTPIEAGAERMVLALFEPVDDDDVLAPTLRPYFDGRDDGGPLQLRASLDRPKKSRGDPGRFPVHVLAGPLARLLGALVLGGFLLLLMWRRVEPVMALRLIVFAVLALSPQVHPWYLLWLLPLEAALGTTAGFALAIGLLASYAPLDLWLVARVWNEPRAGVLLAWGLAAILLLLEAARPAKQPKGSAIAPTLGAP